MPNKRKRAFAALLTKIIANDPDTTKLDFGKYALQDKDVSRLCELLPDNKKVKYLNVAHSNLEIATTERLFETFITSNTLKTLNMPLWGVVNTPSQKPLMRMQKEFELSFDAYKYSRSNDIKGFTAFQKCYGFTLPPLCQHLIEEYLLGRPKKRLIL